MNIGFPVSTLLADFKPLYSTNDTGATAGTLAPTTNEPDGEGVLDLSFNAGQQVANQVKLIFYGTTTANQTLLAVVWGWDKCGSLWIPYKIVGLTATLGTAAGEGSGSPGATDLIADTITLTSGQGYCATAYEIASPADNTPAHVIVDVRGARKIQVELGLNSSSTNTNVAAKLY